MKTYLKFMITYIMVSSGLIFSKTPLCISHWPLQFGLHPPSCPSLISGDLSLRPLSMDSVLSGFQLDLPSRRCSLGSGNPTTLLCPFGLRSDNSSPMLWALDIVTFCVVFPKPWPTFVTCFSMYFCSVTQFEHASVHSLDTRDNKMVEHESCILTSHNP